MRNIILNVTADNTWQTLAAGQNFPENAASVTIQPRTNVDAYYKWWGREQYMTIKSGGSVTLIGKFDPGELQVRAANAVILEIEISTNLSVFGR